jgi:hypothetical protein
VSFDGLSDMAEVWRASGGERRGAGAAWLMPDDAELQLIQQRCRYVARLRGNVVAAGQRGGCAAARNARWSRWWGARGVAQQGASQQRRRGAQTTGRSAHN